MKNLKDYIKDNAEKIDSVTTSIQLTRDQLEFCKKLNLNLSKLVRDYLDQIIEENKNEK
jgi:hypothetical protein